MLKEMHDVTPGCSRVVPRYLKPPNHAQALEVDQPLSDLLAFQVLIKRKGQGAQLLGRAFEYAVQVAVAPNGDEQ